VATVNDPLRVAEKRKALKELELVKKRRQVKGVARLGSRLGSETGDLQGRVGGFIEVWKLIDEDICNIITRLKQTVDSKNSPSLYQSLNCLPKHYAGLMDALDLYVSTFSIETRRSRLKITAKCMRRMAWWRTRNGRGFRND